MKAAAGEVRNKKVRGLVWYGAAATIKKAFTVLVSAGGRRYIKTKQVFEEMVDDATGM